MTQVVETKFNFKARKITDEQGKEIGKTKKQDPVTVNLPMPTVEDLKAYLDLPDDDKRKQLILEGVRDVVKQQARAQFDEIIESFGTDQEKVVTAEMIDFDKLTWAYIANLPPAQRGARAIPEEDWNVFYEDYLATMVTATGKPEKKIANQVEIFKKPTRARTNVDVLNLLVDQLDVYLASSANAEDTGECASRLRAKFEKWSKDQSSVVDVSAL